MGEYSKVEIDGRLMIVTINRPEVYNACHPMANQELSDVFDRFQEDPDLWVAIITGAGDKAFSAGNDLKYQAEYRKKTGKSPVQPPRRQGGLASRFDLDKPVIAAVNGIAMGGGFEIAMGMLLTGRHVSAQEGFELGFVTEVVPHAELMGAAKKWAGDILACSPMSVRATKQVVMRSLDVSSLEIAMHNLDYPAFVAMTGSEDMVEGPRAFAEKRKPNWTGR